MRTDHGDDHGRKMMMTRTDHGDDHGRMKTTRTDHAGNHGRMKTTRIDHAVNHGRMKTTRTDHAETWTTRTGRIAPPNHKSAAGARWSSPMG